MPALRFLAAVVAILIMAPASLADESSALKAIEKVEGKVTRDEVTPGMPVTAIELAGPRVTDAILKELKEFKQLQILGLGATGVTDAGLKELKELKELQTLLLLGDDVTDTTLKQLEQLKQLRTLILSSKKVTDPGIADLKKSLPDLVVTRIGE